MLKILLVDDEILVRVGIKMLVDWNSEGFEIAGEASNGLQALEMWEGLKPDIIITDMKMPQMDGTELIRKLKQLGAKTKVLILSCYDDYNYMKEALNCGAADYILKPEMNKENLTQALRKIGLLITEESNKEKEYYQLKNKAELSSILSRERFFKEIIYGKQSNPADIRNILKDYGIDTEKDFFVLMVISASRNTFQNENNTAAALGISLYNIIQGVINASTAILLHDDKSNDYIAVFYGQEEKFAISEIRRVAANIIHAVKTYLQLPVFIGISEPFKGINTIGKQYDQVREIARYKLLFNAEDIITFNMLNNETPDKMEYKRVLKGLNDILSGNISDENLNTVIPKLEDIFGLIKESQSTYLLNAVVVEFAGWFNKQAAELSIDISSESDRCLTDFIAAEDLFGFESLSGIRDFILEKMLLLARLKSGENQGNRTVKKAVDYIKQNYNNEITLSSLAEHVNVSKNYLSIIFKTETGQNFIDFLTNLRINIARLKLENEDVKVYEVATAVGFDNERYFSQIFRRKTGMTPTEYKKNFCKA